MTWRIRTTHRSTYHYGAPVVASYNELRLLPRSTDRQSVVQATVDVVPDATRLAYRDYWGTDVLAVDLHVPHDRLDLVGRSVVDTGLGPPEPPRPAWHELLTGAVQDAHAELLAPTSYVPLEPSLGALAAAATTGLDPLAAVDAVAALVADRLRYEPGTTKVTTSALQAFDQASGVCQDFAHVTLALLRHLRLPARYVSGYLHPTPDAALGAPVTGASHAWVEVFLGRWHPVDPTNAAPVRDRHVAVAHGRDYADVAPVVGIYQGGNLASLAVEVVLERLA